ncbi:MAG: hypothetical protein R6X33_11420, partial [Candidatus Brocadiia bacterium]
MDANVTFVEEVWPSNPMDLYRFEIELDTPVNMDDGWVSVQSETVSSSSGMWFLWMNSFDGDLLSTQHIGTAVLDAACAGVSDGVDNGGVLDLNGYDLAGQL